MLSDLVCQKLCFSQTLQIWEMSHFAWRNCLLSVTHEYYFQWPWVYLFQSHISVKQFENSAFLLIQLNFCMVVYYINWILNIYITIFDFPTYSREVNDNFPDLTKTFYIGVFQTLVRWRLLILYGYNHAWGLPICIMFDDLDLVSRLQVCKKRKLKGTFFRFFSSVIYKLYGCYIH